MRSRNVKAWSFVFLVSSTIKILLKFALKFNIIKNYYLMGRTKQTPRKPKIDKLRDRLTRLENQRERYLALLDEAKGIEISEETIEKIKNEIEAIDPKKKSEDKEET
jgi:hypothetical protein